MQQTVQKYEAEEVPIHRGALGLPFKGHLHPKYTFWQQFRKALNLPKYKVKDLNKDCLKQRSALARANYTYSKNIKRVDAPH